MKDLSLHILDLAQNSIVAGATYIRIAIIEATQGEDKLSLTLEDNGCGMSQEMVDKVQNPFVTTRTTRKVGLGIPLFKAGCENCGGDTSIKSELGVGTTISGWYTHSSIDRPPLGDVSGTIVALVLANPLVRIRFEHTYNTETFCFDTQELREILGDTPLDTPEVLSWIRDYLNDNEQEIYGGAKE